MERDLGMKRKLAAILNADVQGYSRLMTEDEEGTVSRLGHCRDLMRVSVENHGGRVVDFPGDNLLAEFPSAVEAVRAAVEIQEELVSANSELPIDRQMRFRIGINLGDVIQEGDRIYGDGVNVAARIQELASAGGICISESVYEQVENKLAFGFEYLGEQLVKNIQRPVRVYRVTRAPHEPLQTQREDAALRGPRTLRWAAVIPSVLLLAGLGWFLLYKPAEPPHQEPPTPSQSASASKVAGLAVLPFLNLSPAAEQERLGEGIAEDIITALSAMPRLSVVSRTTTFKYKDSPLDLKELGKELNVQYVVEGSVQKEGDRLRVTVQLIDVATGLHVWADRFDLEGTDTFATKDEVTLRVMKSLPIQIGEREGFPVKPRQTESLEAYLRFLKGRSLAAYFDREKNVQARRLFQEAVSLDPGFVDAHLAIVRSYLLDWWFGWGKPPEQTLEIAWETVEKALKIDTEGVNTCGLQSQILGLKGRHGEAVAVAKLALERHPDSPEALAWMGVALYYDAKIQEAITFLEKSSRLAKRPAAWYLHYLGFAYVMVGRNEEAVALFQKALISNERNPWALMGLVGALALAGRKDEALEWASKVMSFHPALPLELFASRLLFPEERQRAVFLGALREAGLE